MKTLNLGIDIGGSHIACAMVDKRTGIQLNDSLRELKIDSKGSIADIVDKWISFISESITKAGINEINGIGFAMPGPFDYERGIAKISGVDKFESVFGLNVRLSVLNALKINSIPVMFTNDATCFALGEYYAGAAKGSKRALIITLGTGFGSTFLVNGKPQTEKNEKNGIPEDGYLYNISCKESIADDYFSTRWFTRRWNELTGNQVDGVKEIACKAEQYDKTALALFDEFASNLSEFLHVWLKDFNPETLIIAGSIAKASALFLPQLKMHLLHKGLQQIEIKPSELWDIAPIVGAAMNVNNMNDETEQNLRKTEQFLAPEKTQPTSEGKYDIYPGFPVGTGKIQAGSKALAEWILRQKNIMIDGYIGVYWDKLAESLNEELLNSGKKIRWFYADAAMRPESEIDKMVEPYLGGDDPVFGHITDKDLADWFYPDKLQQIQPDDAADINIIIGCGAALANWKSASLIYVDLPKNELQFRARAKTANNLGVKSFRDGKQIYKRFYFVDWRVLDKHKCKLLPEIDLIIDEQRPVNYLFMSGGDARQGLSAMAHNFFRVRPWFEPGAWGGTWMREHIEQLNKDVENLAWSFELMVLENGIMFESDGYLLEISFDFLMYNNYKEVLGDCADRFKYDFPIRFDFLDTFDGGNLSVQCHPQTKYIQEKFGMPFTQDETYYILDCQNQPVVYLGFQDDIQPEEFERELIYSQEHAQKIDIEKYVQKHAAKKHDFFLIPNGTIHASGKDNLVLEISSAPYIFTFKMYDWLRLDLDGYPRPINIEHGMNNLCFDRKGKKIKDEFISHPYILEQTPGCILEHLPTHPVHFYDVQRYTFNDSIQIETKGKCHVWMLVEGISVTLETSGGMKQRFNYAETFVIPADTRSYTITNNGKTKAIMLKAFVK